MREIAEAANARDWRKRAQELRVLADQIVNAEVKGKILSVAAEYEAMADDAEKD